MSLVKKPWAASSNDGEWCYLGNDRQQVIDEAVEAWIDSADSDDPPESIEVVVFCATVWCDGEEDGDRNDCCCGGHHDEDQWEMTARESMERVVYTLTVEDREMWE